MTRVRTEKGPPQTGTITFSKADFLNRTSSAPGDISRCEDVVAPGDGHALTIEKTTLSGSYQQNGSFYAGVYGTVECTNYPIHVFRNLDSGLWDPLAISDRPSYTDCATRLVAMTNPSRPDVDIPVFLGELGDIPRTVYLGGSTLLGKGAAGNLSVQFGVIPLISDLNAMLDFVSLVDKRFKELQALSEKGLRRTRTLWHGSEHSLLPNYYTQSSPTQVQTKHDIVKDTRSKIWGHVRWYPSGGFPTTDAAMLRKARRAVGGLTLDLSTAWELIPFSWLADWYGNVGSYLKASRNIVPCFHTIPQIMEESENVSRCRLTWSDRPELQGRIATVRKITKKRRPTPVSLSASLPALTGKQLSILGSLAILRSGKY